MTRGRVPTAGAFAPPVLLDDVTPAMAIARDEVFGPVVCLLDAGDLAEAIRIHNDVAYGLSGAIFTRKLAAADAFIDGARVGLVHVDDETAGAEPHVPFGGVERVLFLQPRAGPRGGAVLHPDEDGLRGRSARRGLFDFD